MVEISSGQNTNIEKNLKFCQLWMLDKSENKEEER